MKGPKRRFVVRTSTTDSTSGRKRWYTLGHVWENDNGTLTGALVTLPVGLQGPLDIALFVDSLDEK
jgi:hypothetical protein